MTRTNDNPEARLLLCGDLHLGRASTRVPGGGRAALRATAAWDRIVELALAEQVAAVCLSGDVVDAANRFFEAVGPLERGIGRLGEAGIRTVAVAGNHDFDVLARLARELPAEHFTLLGRAGTWERTTIRVQGRPVLHLDGWSFPRQRVHDSPLATYRLAADAQVPVLGMVHGDLGAAASPYAPLDAVRLRALGPAGWLLGHVHAPMLDAGPPWLLYPGSPQALDPGETGAHGPWLLKVAGGRMGVPEQRPLSTVRYDTVVADVTGAVDEEALGAALLGAVRGCAERCVGESGTDLAHLSLRLRVTGETPAASVVEQVARDLAVNLDLAVAGASVRVESTDVETLPPIDLAAHADSASAAGTVARLLLALDQPALTAEMAALVRSTRERLEQVERHKDFAALTPRKLSEADVRAHLRRHARALLTELVRQTA